MIVRRRGGMTEFIPSPKEKREGLIRDDTLGLLENLHHRLERIEAGLGLPMDEARDFSSLLASLYDEEVRNAILHASIVERL